jgi:hypothetical protein
MSALCQKRTFNHASIARNSSGLRQINTSSGNLLSVEGKIDALLNVAVFAVLVLCIVGFGAWARKRLRDATINWPRARLQRIRVPLGLRRSIEWDRAPLPLPSAKQRAPTHGA